MYLSGIFRPKDTLKTHSRYIRWDTSGKHDCTHRMNWSMHLTSPNEPFKAIFKRQPSEEKKMRFLRELCGVDVNAKKAEDYFEATQEVKMAAKQKRLKEAVATQAECDRKLLVSMNQNRKNVEFEVGDYVLQYVGDTMVGNKRKMADAWIGPFEISKKTGPVNYKLNRSDRRHNVVHCSKLKLFME